MIIEHWWNIEMNRKQMFMCIFFSLSFQGATVLGEPLKKEKIGETFIPYQVFKDFVRGLAESSFK
jgi:hypothetical protein